MPRCRRTCTPLAHKAEASSDLTQPEIALEDRESDALALQGIGSIAAADAATYNAHVELVLLHQLPLPCFDSLRLVLADEPKQESPAPQRRLERTLNRDLPALNWPAESKRVQDRKRHLSIGADACAQDAWDSAVLQATTRIRLSRRHPPGDRPVNPPDNEA